MSEAPAVICLNSLDKAERLYADELRGKSALFDPAFINRNMTLGRVTRNNYAALAEEFDFFSLRPFLHRPGECRSLPLAEPLLGSAVRLFERMEAEISQRRDFLWVCRTRSFFIRLLTLIEQDYEDAVETAPEDFRISSENGMARVLGYIHANYAGPVAVRDLCRVGGMGKTTLYKRFKKAAGTSVSEYLTEYRMQAAKKSLRFTNLSIREIARESGFKYQTYFTRVFVSRYGISPEKFRKAEVERRKKNFC